MKYVIIFFSAFLMVACKKDKETVSDPAKKDSVTVVQDSVKTDAQKTGIAVDPFPFPKEIKECSCYFAKASRILKTKNTSMQMMPEKQLI
jgi:uncharacterized protein (DUF2141 family)